MARTKPKPYRFRGIDWAEMAEAMGINGAFDDGDLSAAILRTKLRNIRFLPDGNPEKNETLAIARRFMKAYAKHLAKCNWHPEDRAFIAAFAELPDWSFVSWLTDNFQRMWC